MQLKQLALMLLGLAAVLCAVPALYVGAVLMVMLGSVYVFPLPAFCMVGIAFIAFNFAERA